MHPKIKLVFTLITISVMLIANTTPSSVRSGFHGPQMKSRWFFDGTGEKERAKLEELYGDGNLHHDPQLSGKLCRKIQLTRASITFKAAGLIANI